MLTKKHGKVWQDLGYPKAQCDEEQNKTNKTNLDSELHVRGLIDTMVEKARECGADMCSVFPNFNAHVNFPASY